MNEHLLPKKIFMFLQDKLDPDEALAALLHLQHCQKCRDMMPEQRKEDVLKIFLGDVVDAKEINN